MTLERGDELANTRALALLFARALVTAEACTQSHEGVRMSYWADYGSADKQLIESGVAAAHCFLAEAT